ncbi:hypothetical protein BDN72DRAFT_810172 [Pluteus cervinus]|uniref:Uncharacterized protein n=1 Tax=Pluteus cervinus TaxID=181527 RepID=A0ACD3BE38_9AGAR|nr:hypothetical protein BDN72DRAFT_810172 [Pluteus cervinus]
MLPILRPSSSPIRRRLRLGLLSHAHLATDAQQQPFKFSPQQSPHCAPFPKRTHNCGSLTAGDAGSRVILTGWLLPARKGKLVSFLPLKDSSGTTQLIVNHTHGHSLLTDVPVESNVLIEGTVSLRPQGARRPGPTGDIDVQVDNFVILNPAATLPFLPSNPHNLPNEDVRSRYRYLDLRRTLLSDNLKKRHQVARIVRHTFESHDFVEVETPVLLRSSPEGAREFLVPTRSATSTNPDSSTPLFYALQQSPQQPKQLLICSGGIDRYYQIAKCFRDEDGRKDRQPEFTQIDMEMAYVSWGQPQPITSPQSNKWRIGGIEVRELVESLIRKVWQELEGITLPKQFKVMTYHEAMTRFGSDKPDTRFGLEIVDITEFASPVQRTLLDTADEVLECIPIRATRDRGFIDASRRYQGLDSIERVVITQENITSWVHDLALLRPPSDMNSASVCRVNEALRLAVGDEIWVTRRSKFLKGGSTPLGQLRTQLFELAQSHEAVRISKDPHFLWITEFPLFTQGDQDKEFLAKGRWSSTHHPFTAPVWQDIEAMYNGELASVRGQHYDLVLNGVEIGGGSVRIHDAPMQNYIFTEILKLDEKERAPFNQLLHALQCGAPPHGGIALGFDRLMAMLCKTQSIRDVIAFPKSGTGTDLLFKSPAPVPLTTLEQYGIQPRNERK